MSNLLAYGNILAIPTFLPFQSKYTNEYTSFVNYVNHSTEWNIYFFFYFLINDNFGCNNNVLYINLLLYIFLMFLLIIIV